MYFKELLRHVQKMSLNFFLIFQCCDKVTFLRRSSKYSILFCWFLNKVLCVYDIVRSSYLMFHLETFKKCLSLIKHFILHVCANINILSLNTGCVWPLVLFVQVLLSPLLLRLLLPPQYNKGGCNCFCAVDRLSSRSSSLLRIIHRPHCHYKC